MILAAALCAASLSAAEVDAKAQAKTTWLEAAKAGDVWTCLQLEAWGRNHKPAVKLGPALDGSAVYGEMLFAFPSWISYMMDFGDRVVVATQERAFAIAPDGRPLHPSVLLAPEGGRQTAGFGGLSMGTCRLRRLDDPPRQRFEIGSTVLADGRHPVALGMELGPMQSWDDDLVVADDGSAVATVITSDDGPNGRSQQRVLIATDRMRYVDSSREPVGVGRGGAWLLARGHGREGQILVRGERRQPIVAGATGPGLAACLSEGKALLIKRDGSDALLSGAPAIGDYAGLVTLGSWLVMGSGYGAKVVSQGDLMGDNAGATVEQPPTLAFWRWADLLANPAAKPVTTMVGDLSVVGDQPAALWVWKDAALDRIDLSGNEPVRSHYLDAAAPIRWASTEMHCLRIEHEKPQRFALYGPDKAMLWTGECSNLLVKRRDLALSEHRDKDDHIARRLQWLSPEAGKRRTVPLPLPAEVESVSVSVYPPDLVVARGDAGAWWSFGFDGKPVDSGNERGARGVDRPSCPDMGWFMPLGRFYREGARAFTKAEGLPEDPMQRLQLQDAWRIAGSTVLLETSGRVLLSGRKRGEWIDLGAAGGAQRIGLRGTTPALMRESDAKPIAVLIPGPKLDKPAVGPDAVDLPAGPWRLDGSRFTPPRGRQQEWDFPRVGWGWVRLRSPEASGLFIVTGSALIELDPDAARIFGK